MVQVVVASLDDAVLGVSVRCVAPGIASSGAAFLSAAGPGVNSPGLLVVVLMILMLLVVVLMILMVLVVVLMILMLLVVVLMILMMLVVVRMILILPFFLVSLLLVVLDRILPPLFFLNLDYC